MNAKPFAHNDTKEPSTPVNGPSEDLQDNRPLCGWCFAPVPPGEECFCRDVCYAACKTDQFGEVSGRRLALELKVDFRRVLTTWRSGPWFCKVCGNRPVRHRLQPCAGCTPGTRADC